MRVAAFCLLWITALPASAEPYAQLQLQGVPAHGAVQHHALDVVADGDHVVENRLHAVRGDIIDAKPQAGSMTVCVPLPATGDFAIAVQHDANGNRKTDISTDGAGMSNNPGIRKILGLVPRPPSVDKVRFNAGSGVTRMAISMQYM